MQAALKATAGRGTKRKPQPTMRERLAKKLLSGRARGLPWGRWNLLQMKDFKKSTATDGRLHGSLDISLCIKLMNCINVCLHLKCSGAPTTAPVHRTGWHSALFLKAAVTALRCLAAGFCEFGWLMCWCWKSWLQSLQGRFELYQQSRPSCLGVFCNMSRQNCVQSKQDTTSARTGAHCVD